MLQESDEQKIEGPYAEIPERPLLYSYKSFGINKINYYAGSRIINPHIYVQTL